MPFAYYRHISGAALNLASHPIKVSTERRPEEDGDERRTVRGEGSLKGFGAVDGEEKMKKSPWLIIANCSRCFVDIHMCDQREIPAGKSGKFPCSFRPIRTPFRAHSWQT